MNAAKAIHAESIQVKANRVARLLCQYAGQRIRQRFAAACVLPASRRPAKVIATAARRDPDFLGRRMPVDDDLAAVVATDFEYALIERGVIHTRCIIQRVDDALKQFVRKRAEFRGAHGGGRGVGRCIHLLRFKAILSG